MNTRGILLNQLDSGLEFWQQANKQMPRPRKGWVRTIRKALAMTIEQLAMRLGTTPSRVITIEKAELEGNTTLKTLQKVASAVECEFIYAFVPRESLRATLEDKARSVVESRIKRISHSMALEDQRVSKEYQEKQIEESVKSMLGKTRSLNALWDDESLLVKKSKKKVSRYKGHRATRKPKAKK